MVFITQEWMEALFGTQILFQLFKDVVILSMMILKLQLILFFAQQQNLKIGRILIQPSEIT